MKKRKIHKKSLAVFLLAGQLIVSIIPGSLCLASQNIPADENITGQSAETGQSIANQSASEQRMSEQTEEQSIAAQELDLGDYEEQMNLGTKQLLSVTVLPLDATDQNITYSSSNTQVATINGMGRITAVGLGTTEITAACGMVTGSFTLTVVEAETEKTIEVTDIELADYEEELQVDKTMNLSATVLPSDAADTTVKFSSDNTQIATVSSTGEVKGISPGQVTITMQAGNFTKSIVLTVKVATTAIILNSTYVVLKPGEVYQLSGQVQPGGASQSLTFKSVDTGIATVSGSGTITAKEVGNTTIIVSNKDMSTAVTVIVNETGEASEETPEETEEAENTEITTREAEMLEKLELLEAQDMLKVKAEEYDEITPTVLKTLYSSGKNLSIEGENYTIELSGEDIVNYQNTLYTELEQKETAEGMEFVLNQGENLPGRVVVSFTKENRYKYIYLYNTSAEKYEKLAQEDVSCLRLNTAGNYLLTTTKIKSSAIKIYVIVGVAVIILALGITYIVIKKKYWFW